MSPPKKADDERCPKCGAPELTTTARQRSGGFVVVTSCPACNHVVRPEPGSPAARAREVIRPHVVKLATKAMILDELRLLVGTPADGPDSVDLALVAATLINLGVLAAAAEGVTRQGLLDILTEAVVRKYGP